MSQWITVMVLLPSQLAAHNPGERINYHIFTFCLDICGIFYWVIYLCWNLWVFHPNHSISGLGIQKSTETKPLALKFPNLDTLADSGHRVCKDVTPSFPFHSYGYVRQEVSGPKEQLQNLAWTSETPLNFLFQPPEKYYPVLLSLCSWWRQIIMTFTIHRATTIFSSLKEAFLFWFFMGFAQSSLWWAPGKWRVSRICKGSVRSQIQ